MDVSKKYQLNMYSTESLGYTTSVTMTARQIADQIADDVPRAKITKWFAPISELDRIMEDKSFPAACAEYIRCAIIGYSPIEEIIWGRPYSDSYYDVRAGLIVGSLNTSLLSAIQRAKDHGEITELEEDFLSHIKDLSRELYTRMQFEDKHFSRGNLFDGD